MIIPSIDLQGGRTVQLVGGEDLAIDAGAPDPIQERFGVVGEIAVIDLDAARGEGDNRGLVEQLVASGPCRVGGGVRDAETALRLLDAGATRVILGTAARPEVLKDLPPERVIAALDARDGEVVVDGWRTKTGRKLEECFDELAPFVGGFMVTFVEREGRLTGMDLERAEGLRALVNKDRSLTLAGGVRDAADVGALHKLGIDVQVGMALYNGQLALGDAVTACLRTDRSDGLFPTVVCDELGTALGLCWSSAESLRCAVDERRGIYWSRSRNELWRKGETSGAIQELLGVAIDCDADALRFTVRQQNPGFCHKETWSCWGETGGLMHLQRTLAQRRRELESASGDSRSFTRKLLQDPEFLRSKLLEEAGELAEATEPRDVAWEAADVLYFTMVRLAAAGVPLADALRELDRRSRTIRRRSESDR